MKKTKAYSIASSSPAAKQITEKGLNMNCEGDVVLVYYQEKPAVYARVEAIEPDIKKDWYHVTFLLLTIPSQTVTWILREEYFNGTAFTMGGNSMMIESVKRVSPDIGVDEDGSVGDEESKSKPGKVIPFKGGSRKMV